VVADNASTTERYAAEELQYWLKQVGGVNLSIVGERKGTAGKRILVGYGNEVKRLLEDHGFEDVRIIQDSFGKVRFAAAVNS
jgi:hypothetical protein